MLDTVRNESAETKKLGPVLLSLLREGPAVQEAAGLAVYKLVHRLARPGLDEILSRFDQSKSLDERAIAAVTRRRNWSKPDSGVTHERLAEGVTSRYAWVRTVAR